MRAPPTFPPDAGMGRLEWVVGPPPAVYYVAHEGSRWRIHDCVLAGRRLTRVPTESEAATCRLFVAETGMKKLYRRRPRELWPLTPARCERQLMEAELLGQPPEQSRDSDGTPSAERR